MLIIRQTPSKPYTAIILWLLILASAPFANAAETNIYPRLESFKVMEGDNLAWSQQEFVDSEWNVVSEESVDPQGKLLWIRAHFDLPQDFDKGRTPLGLLVYGAMSSETWLNGELLGGNGKPASNAAEEVPGNMYSSFYVEPNKLKKTNNLLAIRMSSFHLRKPLASPIHCICFDSFDDPKDRFLRYYSPTLLTSSALLLGAIYFAWLFAFGSRTKSNLALSLLSFSLLAQMAAEISRGFVDYPYPLHLLRLDIIQIFAMSSGLALVWYMAERYGKSIALSALILTFALMIGAYLFFNGYDSKTLYTILAAVAVALGIATTGFFRKSKSAIVIVIGLVSLCGLFLFNPFTFLDLNYYLGATFLIILLFVQQAIMLRRSQENAEQSALRATRLELELLKRHIHPHFLLNTLTALSELIESAPKKGVQMIEALAEEIRMLLLISNKPLIQLDNEIDLCRSHLKIMSLRREQNFNLSVVGESNDIKVPPGVVHTLVENALTHNAYQGNIEFELSITSPENSWSVITLQVPLQSPAEPKSKTGMGHSYIKARMQETFGSNWEFTSGLQDETHWVDSISFKGI